jgi:5-methylcytosine-specific restriction endonuclease McrA
MAIKRGRRWRRFREDILRRDGYRCTKCGRAGRLEVHHVTPLEHGGAPFDTANCTTVCHDCHRLEHGHAVTRPGAWDSFAAGPLQPDATERALRARMAEDRGRG